MEIIKLYLLADIDMLLTIKKGYQRCWNYVILFINMQKVIIKIMIKVKNDSILSWNVKNLFE